MTAFLVALNPQDSEIRSRAQADFNLCSELQRQALKEAWKHDDIVQFSFTEHYENMTLKSIMMLKWAEQWQPTFLVG